MLENLIVGAKIGFMVAAPVGPVVILHMRMASLYGFFKAMRAGMLTSCSVGVHAFLGLVAITVIEKYITEYMNIIQIIMGLIVLGVAIQMFVANKKLVLNPDISKVKTYYPALLSFVCPFTTILLVNLITARLGTLPNGVLPIVSVGTGSILGSFLGYVMFCSLSYFCSRKFSQSAVIKANKIAPVLIVYYGLEGLWKGVAPFIN